MNSRDQFEESYSKVYGTPKRVLESLRYNDTYRVTDGDRVDVAWCIWKASREQLAVELPEPFKMAKSSSNLLYYYADEVIETLKTAGITVKSD